MDLQEACANADDVDDTRVSLSTWVYRWSRTPWKMLLFRVEPNTRPDVIVNLDDKLTDGASYYALPNPWFFMDSEDGLDLHRELDFKLDETST